MSRFFVTMLIAMFAPAMAFADESAESVLSRMVESYALLQSYRDSGTVRFQIIGLENEITFETAFVRPNSFRFGWVSHHPFPPLKYLKWRSVIWSTSTDSYTWNDGYLGLAAETRKDTSLAMSVAGATGVSGGAANTIATLLMPDIWGTSPFGTSLRTLAFPKLTGIESVESVDCYHIVGTASRGEQYDLWLGTKDYLLRKMQRLVAGSPQIELHRDIQVNIEIAPQTFSAPTQ